MKSPLASSLLMMCFGQFMSGCSNLNENVWHSLKAKDASLHPSLEDSSQMQKPITYDQYAKERKNTLGQP